MLLCPFDGTTHKQKKSIDFRFVLIEMRIGSNNLCQSMFLLFYGFNSKHLANFIDWNHIVVPMLKRSESHLHYSEEWVVGLSNSHF
jgi:hypothetical protein